MRKLFLAAIFLFTVTARVACSQTVNDLVFYTNHAPPYNFIDENGKLSGLSVDILEAVLKKLNSTLTVADINIVNWDDGYNKVLNTNNAVLFGMKRRDDRERSFKWAGPIAAGRDVVLAKKGRKPLASKEDLKNYRVGVIKNAIGYSLAKEVGVPDSNIIIATNKEDIFKALDTGKIDFWIQEDIVAQWFLMHKGVWDKVEIVAILNTHDISFAFNKSVFDNVIAAFQDAIDEIRSTGEYDRIVRKYVK